MATSEHLRNLLVQHDSILEEFDALDPQATIWVNIQADLGTIPEYYAKRYFSFKPEYSDEDELGFEYHDSYNGDVYSVRSPYDFFDNVEKYVKEAEEYKKKIQQAKKRKDRLSAQKKVQRLELKNAKKRLEEGK